MSKFTARKGLALAAATVLGVSLLTAAPAQAAGELTLVPAAGTKWAVPSTNGFGVKAYFTSGYSSSEAAKLHFMVTAAGNASVDVATGTSAVYAATTDLLNGVGVTSASKITAGGSPTYAAFEMENNDGSTTETITVQAWIDSDLDGTIDAGEWSSAVETITFIKFADVDWSLDIVNPTEGDTTAEARVTSSNINLAQLTTGATTSQVAAVFYDGTSILFTNTANAGYDVTTDADIAAVAMAYSATKDWLSGTSAATTALAAADTIKADIYFEATAAAETSAGLDIAIGGSDGLVTVVANDATEATRTEAVAASRVTSLGAVTSVASANNSATAAAAVNVRTGATSLVATSTAAYETGITSASVTFTISENAANSLVSGASITSGGETLTNANAGLTETIDVVVTADALGVATLNMTLAGMTNTASVTNAFTIVATTESHTGTLATYTVATGAAASLKNTNAIGVNGDSSELVFPVGSAFTLTYAALDTYGALLSTAGHTVTVSDGSSSWSSNVVNGIASIVVPAYTVATTKTMTPVLYLNGVDVSIAEPTAEVTIGTVKAAASVTGTGDSGTASNSKKGLNLKASTAADTRTGASAPAVTASTNVVVTGNVKDSNLDGVATSVTLSSTGLLFEADGVWSVGSITVQTSAAGAYSVDVRSNFAGKKVVTITSGSASVTEELWFDDAADSAGTALTLNAPVSVSPGSTLQITGSLFDAFGNPVTADGTGEKLTFTYTGPGYAGAVPTVVAADGTFSYNVLLGTNDKGSATITVAYDLDGDGDYTDTGDILVSKTVTIGAVASATKVNAGSFKGYVALYAKGYKGQRMSAKVGKDWVVVASLASDFERVVEFTGAGVDVAVRIYIDRVLMDTINLTTK